MCIIGSGPGGGIAALELARSGRVSVILVDTDRIAAPYTQPEDIKMDAVLTGHSFNQEITRGFGFGGSSNLWHGVITELDEEDWQFIDLTAGDNVSREIKSLYGDLKYAFGTLPSKASSRFSGKSVGDDLYRALELSGKFRRKNFFMQKHPFRVRNVLASFRESCPDIEFVENATALYLIGNGGEPSQATALVVDVGGQQRRIEADYFILAAGALETPRIVLQGNENNHFSIKNDNIGHNLFDHPWAVVGEIVSKKGWFRLGLSDVYAAPGLRYRIGYRLQESVDNPEIGSNHCIAFKPIFFGDYAIFKEAMKSIISNPSLKSIFGLLGRFKLRDVLASLFLLVCEKFALGVFVKRSLVFCYLEQPIRAESSVSLTKQLDASGRRIPAINWVVDMEEADSIKLVQATLSDALSGSERFSFIPYGDPSADLASGSHHAGTMRIGTNSQNGVIDKDLMLFGSKNVFVCDLSIFPNNGNSNPTFTLAAFSLRLSRHILRVMSPEKSPRTAVGCAKPEFKRKQVSKRFVPKQGETS